MATSSEISEAVEAVGKAIPGLLADLDNLGPLDHARALNQLAEALAWLRVPGQPHGSSGSSTD